jgi:hypothetical protein
MQKQLKMFFRMKKYRKDLIYLGSIILLLLIALQQCNRGDKLDSDLAMANTNIAALQDSVTSSKNKIGQLQYQRATLITSEKSLKSLNADLAKEVEAQRGKIAQLNRIISVIRTPKPGPIDGSGSTAGDPCDSTGYYTAEWTSEQKFSENNYRNLAATTQITVKKKTVQGVQTEITRDEIGFDIITGLEKRDGGYEIFVRSNYPGFQPTKIEGAFIPQNDLFPPQKRKNISVGVGPQVGLGVTPTLVPTFYFGVGLGIQYSFFKF